VPKMGKAKIYFIGYFRQKLFFFGRPRNQVLVLKLNLKISLLESDSKSV